MKQQKLVVSYDVYQDIEELPVADKRLMVAAVAARENAYAPYSKFHVGAAVLLSNGEVVIGNNQENASYPSGLCAERVAIFHAGAKYPKEQVISVAISATSVNYKVSSPAAPCGNCRQAIAEYEQKQKQPISIVLMGEIGEVIKIHALQDILPLAFSSDFL